MKEIIDHEREALWQQLNDAANKLGVPSLPRLHIGLKLLDGQGRPVMESREEGHSWTRNAWNLLFSTFGDAAGDGGTNFGAGYMSARTTANALYAVATAVANRNSYSATSGGHVTAGVGSTSGLRVGSSDQAFNINDIELIGLIAHSTGGTTAGTLEYRAMAAATKSYNSTTKRWTSKLAREFKNGNASTVTVREVGTAWIGALFMSSSASSFLTARDVLATPVVVAPDQVLVVTYEISQDYSSVD